MEWLFTCFQTPAALQLMTFGNYVFIHNCVLYYIWNNHMSCYNCGTNQTVSHGVLCKPRDESQQANLLQLISRSHWHSRIVTKCKLHEPVMFHA